MKKWIILLLGLTTPFEAFADAVVRCRWDSAESEKRPSYRISWGLSDEEFLRPTSDLYGAKSPIFCGPYRSHRMKMDYSYHPYYQYDRQALQDQIIARYLDRGKTTPRPTLLFTAGPMGAGKTHVLKKLAQEGALNLSDYVLIDPDQIKYELPEMCQYIQFDPRTAGSKVHKESAFLQEIILKEALIQGKNVIVDGTLKDVEWFRSLFLKVREDHPHYQIEILHVTADTQKIYERIEKRGKETGRYIPLERVDEAIRQVPQSIDALGPLADRVTVIDNSQDC